MRRKSDDIRRGLRSSADEGFSFVEVIAAMSVAALVLFLLARLFTGVSEAGGESVRIALRSARLASALRRLEALCAEVRPAWYAADFEVEEGEGGLSVNWYGEAPEGLLELSVDGGTLVVRTSGGGEENASSSTFAGLGAASVEPWIRDDLVAGIVLSMTSDGVNLRAVVPFGGLPVILGVHND